MGGCTDQSLPGVLVPPLHCSDRGLFKNEGGTVTSLVSKADYYAQRSEEFVEQTFNGSLPAFLAAFGSRHPLSAETVEQLRKLISEYGEE